ncbi:MAG: toprim domain-containing protein, partial [Ruminococcus sp.]|nr:toprim domain-containing protein [Ruminococcus sp.]
MNDTIETLKPFLLDYVKEITEPSGNGSKNQYICPLCGSGTGSHRSGAFTVYPDTYSYYCFSCNAHGDIFNLYGKMNNISDFPTISKELQSKYGVVSVRSQSIRQKKQPLKPAEVKEERDYTKFFYVAEQHLHKTDYLTQRGLSIETQRKFRCGYIENYPYYNHTKFTDAIIIPTSNSSYMWRSTTENVKQKRGTAHILNVNALNSPYCFVVEGEIDCMSVDECGYACIGLGSTSNIRKIFEYDTSKTVLIIAMDNDPPEHPTGQKTAIKLSELCDEYRVPYIVASKDIWSDCKDANELLVKDRIQLIQNLQRHFELANSLDKDKWLLENLERKQAVLDWKSELKRNQTDNSVKNLLQNIYLILSNDADYNNKIGFNELKQMRSYNNQDWSDLMDSYLKLYFEQEYGLITSIESINHICNIIASKHSYHPIRDYINSTQWDGIHRIRSVFTDFLGATDNVYTQSVAVVTFVGAVARIFEPGVKFDTCTVFVGKQGTGKSKFISKIAVKH